ncbi:ABC transporter permease subunit [uncultured Azohydromonas sp.]|jgi:ABC-type transport system involved in multi-copper enzyme maturation, permease component|uniref:ABC transporter permease subunit n=1 Tax=uncultured Azohydromonas sp. TaxID=487342 RepID=UPI002619FB1C|nr:ABC transporter permease subunit [uncultured Azohydromonas sp.]
MRLFTVAAQEVRVGLRNRWVLATTVLMAALALSLALLGSAPTGVVKADPLAVVVVSLASLTIFLVPLIALLLSFDSIVGEHERGTLMLLLAYPVARWQVVVGKGLGQVVILGVATVLGYGSAAAALWLRGGVGTQALQAFGGMVLTSVMLGASFVAIGGLASTLVRERATAAGLAVGVWLFFVLLYDTALLGVLVADQGRVLGKSELDALLLLNPTDVYRLFNMTASEAVSVYSGMAGPGDPAALPAPVFLAVLAAWVLVPLALAVAVFRRRPL